MASLKKDTNQISKDLLSKSANEKSSDAVLKSKKRSRSESPKYDALYWKKKPNTEWMWKNMPDFELAEDLPNSVSTTALSYNVDAVIAYFEEKWPCCENQDDHSDNILNLKSQDLIDLENEKDAKDEKKEK